MNRTLLFLFLLIGLSCQAKAVSQDTLRMDDAVSNLTRKVELLEKDNKILKHRCSKLENRVSALGERLSTSDSMRDSIDMRLREEISSNAGIAGENHNRAIEKIQSVEESSDSKIDRVSVWGVALIAFLLVLAIGIYVVLRNRIVKGADALSSIRDAQRKLEEEAVRLDTKLVELFDRQLTEGERVAHPQPDADHSLVLKVADEITRIEKNLSRMESSVKGYKPLEKAVGRIKDNFKANGYEVVTYIGQAYNEGMRVNPEFVTDESLPKGARVITSVSKPQVHFNGELIQKASVTVSENI